MLPSTCSDPMQNQDHGGRRWCRSSRMRTSGFKMRSARVTCSSSSFLWTSEYQCVPFSSLPSASVFTLLLHHGTLDILGEDNSSLGPYHSVQGAASELNLPQCGEHSSNNLSVKEVHQKCPNNSSK